MASAELSLVRSSVALRNSGRGCQQRGLGRSAAGTGGLARATAGIEGSSARVRRHRRKRGRGSGELATLLSLHQLLARRNAVKPPAAAVAEDWSRQGSIGEDGSDEAEPGAGYSIHQAEVKPIP